MLRDERVHVGNRNEDLCFVAGQRHDDLELIEIPRRIVVDGAPDELAEITNLPVTDCGRDRGRMSRELRQLAIDAWRKLRFESALPHRLRGGGLQIDGLARRAHARPANSRVSE